MSKQKRFKAMRGELGQWKWGAVIALARVWCSQELADALLARGLLVYLGGVNLVGVFVWCNTLRALTKAEAHLWKRQ
jgi:hypothetical protein